MCNCDHYLCSEIRFIDQSAHQTRGFVPLKSTILAQNANSAIILAPKSCLKRPLDEISTNITGLYESSHCDITSNCPLVGDTRKLCREWVIHGVCKKFNTDLSSHLPGSNDLVQSVSSSNDVEVSEHIMSSVDLDETKCFYRHVCLTEHECAYVERQRQRLENNRVQHAADVTQSGDPHGAEEKVFIKNVE